MLTKQLLYAENLAASWADIIISTVDKVSLFVRPAVKENCDDMDIRKYVHIKKVCLLDTQLFVTTNYFDLV